MADRNKYDGSTNPFDDPDEIAQDSAQEYTSLHLPQQHVHHMSPNSTTNNNENINLRNNNNNQNPANRNTSNSNNNNKTLNKKENENKKFTQKTKEGVNNALQFTSDKIGKPIISFSQKMNEKITRWLNI